MKKILFVSFYWPPSGKASYHFPLKMIQYLNEKGHKIALLTVNEDTFSAKDETFIQFIPDNLKVIKTGYFDPFIYYKKFLGKEKETPMFATEVISTQKVSLIHKVSLWIRMNLFIPDARIGWYKQAVAAGKELLKTEKYDVIITNGPPHSVHLIGVTLSKKFNIPLIPILIDPWVDIASYKNQTRNKFVVWLDNYLEEKTMKIAKAAVFVTKSMMNYFKNKYEFMNKKSFQLYWGYNEEDFDELKDNKNKNEYKTILHAGNMYEYQNPNRFWETVKNKIDKGDKLRLKFIGSLAPNIKDNIVELGLDKYTEFLGFLDYKDVIKEIVNADYLLACTHEPRHVPGKLFEYMRAKKPIIVFGEENKEVNELITKAGLGKYYSFNENAEDFFDFANTLNSSDTNILCHNRRKIAMELEKIINTVC